jgi:hypothetical protein
MPAPTARRRAAPGRLIAALALSLVPLVAVVAATAGSAGAAGPPTVAQPTTTLPPPTVPTTLPPTTAAPTTGTTQAPVTVGTEAPTATTVAPAGGDSNDTNWALVALAVGIVIVIGLIVALLAGNAGKRSRQQGALQRRIAHVVGGAQWVHDQASLDLIGGTQPPDRLRVAWDDTRRRMNDMGAEATSIAVDAHDQYIADELTALSHALGLLVGALDTSVGLRLDGTGDPRTVAATNESFLTVNERRHDLHAALVPLARRV